MSFLLFCFPLMVLQEGACAGPEGDTGCASHRVTWLKPVPSTGLSCLSVWHPSQSCAWPGARSSRTGGSWGLGNQVRSQRRGSRYRTLEIMEGGVRGLSCPSAPLSLKDHLRNEKQGTLPTATWRAGASGLEKQGAPPATGPLSAHAAGLAGVGSHSLQQTE